MKYRRLFLFALITALLAGCASDKQKDAEMAYWMGRNMNDLMGAWGRPSSVMSDGNGGQILIYDWSSQLAMPAPTTMKDDMTEGNAAVPVQRQRIFWADAKGTLYRWSWRDR
jgi:outer membrane biogenesis lipoprotein LolB